MIYLEINLITNFLNFLQSEHRTLAAFVLACIVNNYPQGQESASAGSLVSICLEQLGDMNASLRQWSTLCLGRLWHNFDKARWCGVRDIANEKLFILLRDPVPEVKFIKINFLNLQVRTFIQSNYYY